MVLSETHHSTAEEQPASTRRRKFGKAALILALYPGVGIAGGVIGGYANIQSDKAHLSAVRSQGGTVITRDNQDLASLRVAVGSDCDEAMAVYGIGQQLADMPLEGAAQQLIDQGSCAANADGNLQAAISGMKSDQQSIVTSQNRINYAAKSLGDDYSMPVSGFTGMGGETAGFIVLGLFSLMYF